MTTMRQVRGASVARVLGMGLALATLGALTLGCASLGLGGSGTDRVAARGELRVGMAGDYPSVNWVHVEVYQGFNEADFAPDVDHLVPAVTEFRLPSEPWIFVMDEQGTVTARLEGVLAPGELEELLDA